ncbi:hypothetical protein EDC02_3940 [Micromonospora sp. Llam0]|nr:hypothetical protein [Micromonospora sp. Llam0]ROO61980.1 hypothetical protein EDC02_3940 [Micromonospora sp. Llam0]
MKEWLRELGGCGCQVVERMTEAAFDLPDAMAGELFDRFLVWTWRPC